MLIEPFDLFAFIDKELRGSKPLEGSEIITKYEEYVTRKALATLLHTSLSLPLKNINKFIHDFDTLCSTYIPTISLGRCSGHTTALIEYITSDDAVKDITVVVYDTSVKDNFLERIQIKQNKSNYRVVVASSFSREDFSNSPHVIFDGSVAFQKFAKSQVLPLLIHSKVVVLGV